jgi:HAD superfamily hydrolase (TIGR01549 family)
MKRPAAVLLDYGHTLIGFSREAAAPYLALAYEAINQRLAESLETEIPAATTLIERISEQVDRLIAADYEAGSLQEVDIATLYAGRFAEIGLPLPPDLLEWVMQEEQRAWAKAAAPGPVTRVTLQALQSNGIRLGLVSNAAFLPRFMTQSVEHHGLRPFFRGLTWSSEIGRRKPDPEIYRDALQKVGVAAQDTLFVGDRLREDVRGPKALGMRGILTHEFRQEADPSGEAERIIARIDELLPHLGLRAA